MRSSSSQAEPTEQDSDSQCNHQQQQRSLRLPPKMQIQIALFLIMFATASAFVSRGLSTGRVQVTRQFADKIKITDGVEFDTIAREWRLKWSPDNDKKSLAAVQQSLNIFLPAIKKIDGVQSVQRIVCGGCLDYKVIEETYNLRSCNQHLYSSLQSDP